MISAANDTFTVVASKRQPDVVRENVSVFYYIRKVLPATSEVPDEELLRHVEESGAFELLAEEGEDIYTLEDGEPI